MVNASEFSSIDFESAMHNFEVSHFNYRRVFLVLNWSLSVQSGSRLTLARLAVANAEKKPQSK